MTSHLPETLRGRAALGPEIEPLLDADPHRPGSVDAVLLDRLIPLTPETHDALYAAPSRPNYVPGSRPELERYVRETLADIVHPVQAAIALTRFCALIPRRFPTVERSTETGFYGDFRSFLCGGTEEEVIKKGSPLAVERARVLCAMAQVAGLPARIVFLARTDPPARHAVAEIWLPDRWCAFDGFEGRFYVLPKRLYASVWDARQMPEVVDHHPDHGHRRYVDSAYFRTAAVAAYDIAAFASYDYSWDPISPDLAARLEQGWGA
jgi:hypothetical protein